MSGEVHKRMGVDLFALAIIKGLHESGESTKHFGSLLGFSHHAEEARRAGFICRGLDPDAPWVLTDKGVLEYSRQKLKDAPNCRATHWTVTGWWKAVPR